MRDWMREPMQISTGNFFALFGAFALAIIALPVVIQARDERRIRALEFAERVQKQTTAAPAE